MGVLIIVAVVVLVAASAIIVGRVTFDRHINSEIDALLAGANRAPADVVTEDDLRRLPEPVQRWMRYARVVGKPFPKTARLKQEGRFRLRQNRWVPFEAEQYFRTDPPGFVWSVTMKLAPLVSVRGMDSYVDGTGGMRMKVLSLFSVVDKRGGGLDQGDLLRYLGETIWVPAAALGSQIKWEPIDNGSARALMSHGGLSASATFFFDQEGRPVSATADRYNDAKRELQPWEVPNSEFGTFAGVRVPVAGQGLWHYDAGDYTYIRWRVTDVGYDRPARFRS
jgi:hypothetical protein